MDQGVVERDTTMIGSGGKPALVVVADRRSAEFYAQEQRFSEPRLLFSLAAGSIDGALPAEPTDQPGRSFDSHGEGRHEMEPPSTLREDAAGIFCDAIADRLEQTASAEGLEGLIVIAEPRLLGMLREEVERRPIGRQKRLEIDKNLAGAGAAAVGGAIEEAGGLPRLG